VIEPSLNSTFCFPVKLELSSSSSSSSKTALVVPPFRIVPNAALPPAKENGVDCTAVPKTLALDGAPNAAKSVTTLRGGEFVGVGMPTGGEDVEEDDPNFFTSVERVDENLLDALLAWRYLSVNLVPGTRLSCALAS